MAKKPLILITNDDGIDAPGIIALTEIMQSIAEVVVVAPDSPQSGRGHAITIDSTLHIKKISDYQYSCSGTPADCVKIAINQILERKPDLCVSGINHGSNSSINVIYSGTMGAAIEAGIDSIPAIGFSNLNFKWDANFDASKIYAKEIAEHVLNKGLSQGIVLNVNIPNIEKAAIKGVKICRQAQGRWKEKFDKRQNPQGKDYYWLTGIYENDDNGKDTDEWALKNGYVSIVPVQFDLTAHHYIDDLNSWNFNV